MSNGDRKVRSRMFSVKKALASAFGRGEQELFEGTTDQMSFQFMEKIATVWRTLWSLRVL